MIKNKKGSRPEIKIVAARPMNDVFFTTELFPKTRPNPSPNEKQEYKTSNGLDDTVNRRSTLPGKVREKQRPRSEIYNGFTSLRPVKPAKVDVEVLKRDSKKLGRSKSLYSPKKPPRDLPIRPAPPPPSKQGPKDLQSPRAEQVSPHVEQISSRVEQIASVSPTRPAPPAPIQSFNKKDPTARFTMGPTQRTEMKDKQKRARSKSTSNFSEKQKPRVTSSLPRGKSFHSHGPRQLITPSPDANIVILTRRKSEDESGKSDVKLKSFGIKAARSTDDVKSSQTNNEPKMLSNGNCSNVSSVSDTDTTHERQKSSSDISNAQPAVNDRVSLSDAIQSNAVYERLQQRHEDKTEIGPDQIRPETHNNGLSDADTDDVFVQPNVVSFSDAINSSPVLMKVKQKNSKSNSEEQTVDDSVEQLREHASKYLELVGSSTNSDAVHEIDSVCVTPNSPLITSNAINKSPDSSSRQGEGEMLQNKDDLGKEIKTLSKASDSPERRVSQGRPLPPVVMPKPKVPKRPSIDAANQKSFEDQSKTGQVLNAASQNEQAPKQLPPAIEAECVSAEISNSSQLNDTKVIDATAEKSLHHSTCHVQTNETLLLKDELDSFPCGPLIIKTSKAPKKAMAAESELINASHAVKHGADNTNRIVEISDSKLEKHPIKTSDVSVPLLDNVDKTEDTLLENSNENGDRKKSESEAESSGSIDSLTSIASQVTVIYNPDASTTPTKEDTSSSAVVGPYESHPTKSRRQSVPEPYSSHRERRPKPAKTQSATLTLKTKNRKCKAIIGRRLTSSPPSTPPPPPRTCSLDSESVTTTSDRPPVPPRAPSMYVQSDMRSLDALLNGADKLEKEKSPPPPRPSKPPMLRRAVTLDHRSLKTKADAAVNGSDVSVKDTNSRDQREIGNNPVVKTIEKALNSNSSPRNNAAIGAAAGLSASNESQNVVAPTMGFSQKLDFFDRSCKKPKRPPVLPKQQSLDSRLERSAEERVSELSTEQLRKEGKEALELVSRLRKETSELKDNKKGKSPAPQKPKRPLSFSMENFLLSNASDVDKSNDIGKAEKKKAPPKPGRPASFLKTSSFDEIKHEMNERPINENEASSTSIASFELRSKDAGLYENLDHLREGKNKPIKPVRTSSLKKEKSDVIVKRVATSPNVPEKIEETCDNVEQAANLEVVCEKHENIHGKIEVSVESKMNPGSGKIPEKLEAKRDQNDGQTAQCTKNTPENHTEVNDKEDEKVRNDIAVEKSPEKSIASDALSNQIDKLDKLILETSTVLNESVTESLSSIENSGDQKVFSECGVGENSIKLLKDDFCSGSSNSEGSAISKKQEEAIDHSKTLKPKVDNSTVGTVITKPLESAKKQQVQTENDVEIGEGVGIERFPEASLPQRAIEEAAESKETEVSLVNHDEEIEHTCSERNDQTKNDQNEEVLDSNARKSIGEGSCPIIGDKKRGNADIQSTASTDRVVSPAGKEDTESPQNIRNKGKITLQDSTNARATKIAPTKPPRPRSFPKVINTEYLMKSGHIKPLDNKQVPVRPPLPNDHSRKTSNHTVCQKSPPERPNKMPDLQQSKMDESVVTKRKQSPARTARPPIPLILRENSHERKTEGKSDGDGLMDTIRKNMDVTDPHCIALYDYVSTNETDLNFKEGDLILLDKQINKDWFHGTCDSRKGVFPANFVEVIVELSSGDNDTAVEDLALSFNKPSALGIYSFVAGSEEELSFKSGDTIELTSMRNDDWLEGICHGHRGIFPANFVVIVKPLPEDDFRKSSSSNVNVVSDSSSSSDRTFAEGTNVVTDLNVVTGSATVTNSNVGLDSTTVPNLTFVSNSSRASITGIGAKQTVGSDSIVELDSESGDCLHAKGILIASSDSHVHNKNARTIASEEAHPCILSDGKTQADSECSLNKSADSDNLSGRICTALADYNSDVDGDLCFKAGQDIRIISTVNMEWLKGVLQNRTGIFPKNFVKILDS